jgi:cytochrome c oxidase subunit II
MALLGKFVRLARGARRAWAALALAVLVAPAAWAAEPLPWQMGFQPAASPVRDQIDFLHDDILLPIITVISLFVLGLLLYVIVRYDARRHPTPSKTTHNTVIEVIWTAIPILILLVIFFPSMKLLYYVDRAQKADMTLKVTGRQWYWSYEYPDQNNFAFDSTMLAEDEAGKYGEKRLLGVDKPVVVPVGATVRILVGGSDVIHSWFVPSMGVQEYAVVGRENEAWMKVEKPGTYYGQCNQICGLNHPFMPIEIKAVSKEDFEKWLKQPESLWNVPKEPKKAGDPPEAGMAVAAR